jgi:hypothetical protein
MDPHEDRKIAHFHPDLIVRHLNILFTDRWTSLFTDEPYATKSTETFYQLNEQALTIDVERWRNKFLHMDAKDLPPQRPKCPTQDPNEVPEEETAIAPMNPHRRARAAGEAAIPWLH